VISPLNIAWAAHRGSAPDTGAKAKAFLHQFLAPGSFEMTEGPPDIILFMSGGSERMAISLAQPGHPVLLLAIRGNNAYAAATEVMAWLKNNNRVALLSDAQDAFESGLVERWRQTVSAWEKLEGQKAALIGSVSEWLVASDVPAEQLRKVMGVELLAFPWSELPDFREKSPDDHLMLRFQGYKTEGLEDAARVLTLLREAVEMHTLSAIAVECFSLVQKNKVTACLALAQLNTEGTVAACEGDLASMAGMMLIREACEIVPWMANTTRLNGHRLTLSHCTAAFNLVENVRLATHYETDCSLAVKGMVSVADVTLFRFSSSLDQAMIITGKVTGHPAYPDACRTQVELEISPKAAGTLKNRPLGNHLLMIPGRWAEILEMVCGYKGITWIK
jgi:L-fucose isomerase-like protein